MRGAGQALATVRRARQRGGKRRKWSARRSQRGSFRQQVFHARHRLLKARERISNPFGRLHGSQSASAASSASCSSASPTRRGVGSQGGLPLDKARDRFEAEFRLNHFLAACERAQLAPFTAFANGLRPWREELLAYFDDALTNRYAEGVTNKIKVIKRRAYGVPSFHSFRRRVLLACG